MLDERTRQRLTTIAAAAPVMPALVGGAVRDLLCGRRAHDFDLVISRDAGLLAQQLADESEATFVTLDQQRDTARLVYRDGQIIDFVLQHGPDLLHDLAARDFTINAIAWPLDAVLRNDTSALVDPFNGQADLAQRRLRPCSALSLREDPLRIVRAARFAAAYDMEPTLELLAAAAPALPGLHDIAGERIGSELLRLCDAPAAARGLRLLHEIGALTLLLPELRDADRFAQSGPHRLPVLEHSLETVAGLDWLIDDGPAPLALNGQADLPRELPFAADFAALLGTRRGIVRRAALLKLAGLLHDNAKPLTAQPQSNGYVTFYGHQTLGAERAAAACRRLRLSRSDSEYVVRVVAEHMRPGQIRGSGALTERAIRRFFRDAGEAAADILLHELADHLATRTDRIDRDGWLSHLNWVAACLHWYWAAAPQPLPTLLRGDELMAELGLPAGPQIGRLLRAIAEAQLDGGISRRDEALDYARRLLAGQP